ncbi:MAG: GNAT family N-acetyltransferase [Pseudomonadota bacterium]
MATVREAVEADLGAIQALVDASWLATYAPLIGETETRRLIAEKHNLPKLRRQLAEPDDVFLVAEADGDILGNVYGFPKPLPNRTQANAFYVDRLHARPDAKGRGIGTALIAACEARLPEGAILWLDVLRGNDAACGFYGARGFVQAGETDCCGGLAGIPAMIMQKTVARHSLRPAPPLIA